MARSIGMEGNIVATLNGAEVWRSFKIIFGSISGNFSKDLILDLSFLMVVGILVDRYLANL